MIICQSCGATDDFTTQQKSNNLVATCNKCGRFIKNLPVNKPRLYVGKYKGINIDEIDDLHYLQWAYDNISTLNARTKAAIKDRIYSLAIMLK